MINAKRLWTKVKPAVIEKYNSLDMPLAVFLDAYIDGNFTQVDKDSFEEVVNEYYEGIGGEKVSRQIHESIELTTLEINIKLANIVINRMYEYYSPCLFDFLKTLNFHKYLPAPDFKNWEKYVDQIIPFIKMSSVEYERLVLEQNKKNEDAPSEAKNVSRDTFMDNIIQINSALDLRLNLHSTVREYCSATRMAMQKQKAMERANNHQNIAA